MISEREDLGSRIFGIIITIVSVFAFIGAFQFIRIYFSGAVSYNSQYLTLGMFIIPLWYLGVYQTNLTKFYRAKDSIVILIESLLFVATGTGFLALLMILLNLKQINSAVLIAFAVIDFVLLNIIIMLSYRYHKNLLDKGMNTRNIILIADQNCVDFIERLYLHKEWGFRIMAIISDSELISEVFGSRVKVIQQTKSLPCLIKFHVVDEVLYCRNDINQEEIKKMVYACEEIGVIFRMQSSFFHMSATKTFLSYFDDVPFLSFMNTPANRVAHQWKFVVDLIAAFFILLIWSPVLLILAAIIKLTSKGPVIFKQKRIGLRGREFNIYKFRTMVQDAEKLRELLEAQNEMDGPVFKIKNDPRVTAIGRFMRKTGLDEVPQFFNVLKGDMSLVGPRPPLPKEVKQYERWQLRRLSMRPGITCIWQIAPNRNNISFEEWMKLDLQYIDSWSFKMDILLLIKTVQTVVRGSGQ
ncbi:MAG: sugar transferase [Lentimicrobiaceae bacterium]|nr:sugar transferase [Lentimicrobiaceae bacterium]MCB9023061.1 sugar transferase [Lentimicrobiaceae bacterium]MCO5264585.1 sugar transferase [Lentimicrobium sp.]